MMRSPPRSVVVQLFRKVRARTALLPIASILLLALTVAGCEESPFDTSQSPDVRGTTVATEGLTPNQQLATYLALALNEPGVRQGLLTAMSASPFSEGKVFFGTEHSGPLNGLIAQMAQAGGVSVAEIRKLIQESPDLEMYLPVPEHRNQWSGGEDYLVATVLEEGAKPHGVNPAGKEVSLSADTAPSVPTIALVPAEGFTREGDPREGFIASEALEPRLTSEPIDPVCPPTCGGGGGWSPPDNATWQRDIGIRERISHLRYHNQHEGWPNGAPEFYILLAGTDDTNSDAELTKRIDIPNQVWDNYDHEEDNWALWDQLKLVDWDVDYGTRVRIKCMEADPEWDLNITLSGDTDIAGVSNVQFQGSFQVGNSHEECGEDYISPRFSDGSWSKIPNGFSPEFDGTADLQWYGYGIDVTY